MCELRIITGEAFRGGTAFFTETAVTPPTPLGLSVSSSESCAAEEATEAFSLRFSLVWALPIVPISIDESFTDAISSPATPVSPLRPPCSFLLIRVGVSFPRTGLGLELPWLLIVRALESLSDRTFELIISMNSVRTAEVFFKKPRLLSYAQYRLKSG
jgi:hypothetical protein